MPTYFIIEKEKLNTYCGNLKEKEKQKIKTFFKDNTEWVIKENKNIESENIDNIASDVALKVLINTILNEEYEQIPNIKYTIMSIDNTVLEDINEKIDNENKVNQIKMLFEIGADAFNCSYTKIVNSIDMKGLIQNAFDEELYNIAEGSYELKTECDEAELYKLLSHNLDPYYLNQEVKENNNERVIDGIVITNKMLSQKYMANLEEEIDKINIVTGNFTIKVPDEYARWFLINQMSKLTNEKNAINSYLEKQKSRIRR